MACLLQYKILINIINILKIFYIVKDVSFNMLKWAHLIIQVRRVINSFHSQKILCQH